MVEHVALLSDGFKVSGLSFCVCGGGGGFHWALPIHKIILVAVLAKTTSL